MKKNDKIMDELSSLRIKSIGLDEPSADFIVKVMKVVAQEQPVSLVKQRSYWWVLSLVPVMVAIGYYVMISLDLTKHVNTVWTPILNTLQSLGNGVSSFFATFNSIQIPPMFILGFLAIITLLTIDELINKVKQKSV